MEKFRDRKFRLLLYPDDPTHANAVSILSSSGTRFACILHDRDTEDDGTPKKPHWHIVIKYPHPRWNTALAKDLGIAENYIKPCDNLDGALAYLVHFGYPEKFQYEVTEVFGPLSPAVSKVCLEDDINMRVLNLVQLIDDTPGFITYRELLIAVCNNALYGEFRQLGVGIKYLIDEHNAAVDDACQRALKPTAGAYQDARDLGAFQGYVCADSDAKRQKAWRSTKNDSFF